MVGVFLYDRDFCGQVRSREVGVKMSSSFIAFPKVVVAGHEAAVKIGAMRGGPQIESNREYSARFFSKVDRTDDSRFGVKSDGSGSITCRLRFSCPGEYTLGICEPGREDPIGSIALFALKPALAGLRPYKGDFHVHTSGSDGKVAPLDMAVGARAAGMDFIALTDHDNYAPAVEAVDGTRNSGLGLLVIPGEEVSVRDSMGHILALNISGTVGKERFTPETEAEYDRIAREDLKGRDLFKPLTAMLYSRAVWTARRIRQLGGVVMVAHPYWEGIMGKYFPPRACYEQLLKDRLCEGIELFGGSPSTEGNFLCIARHVEDVAAGHRIPVVGGSDAHDLPGLGRHWSVVFAHSLDAADILKSVLDHRSVACNGMAGPDPLIYGRFDLVEYAYYLHREFFPAHDTICAAQSRECRVVGTKVEGDTGTSMRELRKLYDVFWDD